MGTKVNEEPVFSFNIARRGGCKGAGGDWRNVKESNEGDTGGWQVIIRRLSTVQCATMMSSNITTDCDRQSDARGHIREEGCHSG